jgi:hypothetical protein
MIRGQASTEALAIIGFAILLVFALLYTVVPVIIDFNKFSESAQAERSMSKIMGSISAASSYGPGTETTLYVYLPAGKIDYIADEKGALTYTLIDGTSIVKISGLSDRVVLHATPNKIDGGAMRKVTVIKQELNKVDVYVT